MMMSKEDAFEVRKILEEADKGERTHMGIVKMLSDAGFKRVTDG